MSTSPIDQVLQISAPRQVDAAGPLRKVSEPFSDLFQQASTQVEFHRPEAPSSSESLRPPFPSSPRAASGDASLKAGPRRDDAPTTSLAPAGEGVAYAPDPPSARHEESEEAEIEDRASDLGAEIAQKDDDTDESASRDDDVSPSEHADVAEFSEAALGAVAVEYSATPSSNVAAEASTDVVDGAHDASSTRVTNENDESPAKGASTSTALGVRRAGQGRGRPEHAKSPPSRADSSPGVDEARSIPGKISTEISAEIDAATESGTPTDPLLAPQATSSDASAVTKTASTRGRLETAELLSETASDSEAAGEPSDGIFVERVVDGSSNRDDATADEGRDKPIGEGQHSLRDAKRLPPVSETLDARSPAASPTIGPQLHPPSSTRGSSRQASHGNLEVATLGVATSSRSESSTLPSGADRVGEARDLSGPAKLTAPRGLLGGAATDASSPTEHVDRARFVQRVSAAMQRAHLREGNLSVRLSPPDLGSLQIDMSIRQGVMTASIETETAAARTLLLENLPILRERLAEQDIRIEKFEVDIGREDRPGEGGQHRHLAQQRHQERALGPSLATSRRLASASLPTPGMPRPQSPTSDTGLDIRI